MSIPGERFDEGICQKCEFFVKRLIIPYNMDDIVSAEIDYPEDMENIDREGLYHLMCIELGLELDHIVLECNRFVPAGSYTKQFMRNFPT